MVSYVKDKEPSMFQMWVSPSYRKRGFAEKLVFYLQQWVKASGQNFLVCSVFKSNKVALNLYQRLGFYQTHEDNEEIHLKWDF